MSRAIGISANYRIRSKTVIRAIGISANYRPGSKTMSRGL